MPAVRTTTRDGRVPRAVDRALDRWRDVSVAELARPSVGYGSIPVRQLAAGVQYRAGPFSAAVRLLVWVWAGIRFYVAVGFDVLLRRDTVTRRAVRLRLTFEGLGSTFIKVGQQLSVRADLLPIEYCQELGRMLDTVPPMPISAARRVVERAQGRPIAEIFTEFGPTPIGSASLACVYQARLRGGGQVVAVKVRRPGVANRLVADMRALGWLLQLVEWLGFFKSGYTKALHREFSRMLFEEVDFLREARNTELFRAEAQRAKYSYIQAPRVHFGLCTEDVLVLDYVQGVFLSEILAALDADDDASLQRFREQGIDLQEVARRMMHTAHWAFIESLLFHADPHPANICVQPGNNLMFLDFGSCGRLTGKYRRIWKRFYAELSRRNVQEMVRTALAILEPLPPIDVEQFTRELELMFWDWVHALASEHSAWWETASGLLWMKFADAARRYQAPINAEVLRIFRATFTYDTAIFRLWEQLDMGEEFQAFQVTAGKRARRRVRRAFWGRVENGLKSRDYIKLEDIVHAGQQTFYRVQRYLDQTAPDFAREIGKLSYTVTLVLRTAALLLTIYLVSVIVLNGYSLIRGRDEPYSTIFLDLLSSQWLQIGAAVIVLLMMRKLLQKFQEYDTQ